jgi:hypothetical protein
LEDKGGVIGMAIVHLMAKPSQSSGNPNFHLGNDCCSDVTAFPHKDSLLPPSVREIATLAFRWRQSSSPSHVTLADQGGRQAPGFTT